MGNCVSKKCAYAGQQCDSVIEIIKEVYQKGFMMWFTAPRINGVKTS